VQDSNLRRHTPTDLQNDAAHAVTCAFAARLSIFRTNSSQPMWHTSVDGRRSKIAVHGGTPALCDESSTCRSLGNRRSRS
jgi:hypothetical protein